MELNGTWDSDAIDQYKTVDQIKKSLENSNASYMCCHPEIRAIIRLLLHKAINDEPKNVYDYAADLFNCSKTPLNVEMINKQLKTVNGLLKQGRYTSYDADNLLKESASTHSLLSKDSMPETALAILSFAMIFPTPDECLRF